MRNNTWTTVYTQFWNLSWRLEDLKKPCWTASTRRTKTGKSGVTYSVTWKKLPWEQRQKTSHWKSSQNYYRFCWERVRFDVFRLNNIHEKEGLIFVRGPSGSVHFSLGKELYVVLLRQMEILKAQFEPSRLNARLLTFDAFPTRKRRTSSQNASLSKEVNKHSKAHYSTSRCSFFLWGRPFGAIQH